VKKTLEGIDLLELEKTWQEFIRKLPVPASMRKK